jgi:hypothetical protein
MHARGKVTNLAAVRLRHRVEVRDLALAAAYPQAQSATTPLPLTIPNVRSLDKQRRDNPSPPENVAKPWKKPWDK